MLSAVIIILREVLEASLLTSILLAISQTLDISRKWIFFALGIGALGAGLFAYYYDMISDGLDGTGQEVSNSVMLLMVVAFLIVICLWTTQYRKQSPAHKKTLKWLLMGTVSIAVIREGAEIFIYTYGFTDSMASFLPIFVGACIGAGIGLSIGILVYYLLINLPRRAWSHSTLVVLTLIAAGMSAQVALNLIQANLLPSQMPLWNTSRVLPETSLFGQLLYATFGYEATPTAMQVGFYVIPIISVIVSVLLIKRGGGNAKKMIDHTKTASM